MTTKPEDKAAGKASAQPECFVIMPFSEVEGYPLGHFRHVYENIIAPSCAASGYRPVRGDDIKAANLIHLDILKRLIETPLAICDLSSRNPNVLFELGLRQAFDLPVVLIQEFGTPPIFDIAPLRYLTYSREMKYHEVLKTQNELREYIQATTTADPASVNSIVKLLALNNPAKVPDLKGSRNEVAISALQGDMRQMRRMLEQLTYERKLLSSLPATSDQNRKGLRRILLESLLNTTPDAPPNEVAAFRDLASQIEQETAEPKQQAS